MANDTLKDQLVKAKADKEKKWHAAIAKYLFHYTSFDMDQATAKRMADSIVELLRDIH